MGWTRVVDTALDRSVALGYGRPGLALRRRLPGWPADPPRMDGKVVLVTGAGSGLGQAAATGFARLGATVWAHGRSEGRAAEAVGQVLAAVPGADVRPAVCDVSSLAELRAFTERFNDESDRLDVLVNNAGVMPPARTESVDGIELTFATQVLAPFALIDGLQDRLKASAPARVINVTSGGAYAFPIPEHLEIRAADYTPKRAYGQTKRQLIVITEQWAEALAGSGVVVHSMHPGWAETKGIQDAMASFLKVIRPIVRDAEQGADTIVWMGAAPEVLQSTGKLWHDRRARPTHYAIGASPDDDAARRRVWDHCVALQAACPPISPE